MTEKQMYCPDCGEEKTVDATVTQDPNNPKKSTVSGTCPDCGRSLSRIDIDMSKK